MMYGSETTRKTEQDLIEETKMRTSRWMMRIKMIERDEMRERTGTANINGKIREAKLR